jgi:hypothetical protein
MALTKQEILDQSTNTLRQWLPRWHRQARVNKQYIEKAGTKHSDLLLKGQGRVVVLAAMGPSLEDAIPVLKEFAGSYDLACVDKAYVPLTKAGLRVDWVCVADAKCSYEKFAKPCIEESTETGLIMNATATPKWAKYWKGPVYWYVNKDNIGSEVPIADFSGCHEAIPAASNVGNALFAFVSHMLGYDRHLFVGYDYCWAPDGNYYAFDWGANGKRAYMHHVDATDNAGRLVFTSENLLFSARWLSGYFDTCRRLGLDLRICGPTICASPYRDLRNQLVLAKSIHNRKWTPQEFDAYCRCHSTLAQVPGSNVDALRKILNHPEIKPYEVAVLGVPLGHIKYGQLHAGG